MFRLYFLVLALFLSASPIARAEGFPFKKAALPKSILSESEVGGMWENTILPFFGRGAEGTFDGQTGAKIGYIKFEMEKERGAVVFVVGKGEDYGKYAELAHVFSKEGYSVYITEHRSQGHSTRLAPNPKMVHVEDFDHYVDDLEGFLKQVVHKKPHLRTYAIAHSMGGLIALAHSQKYPRAFDGLVLISPLLQANLGTYTETSALRVLAAKLLLGYGSSYAPTQGDPDALETLTTDESFAKDRMTHSRIRYDLKIRHWLHDADNRMGGTSHQWLNQIIRASQRVRASAQVTYTPTLILEAGIDSLVVSGPQEDFCRRAEDCHYVRFAGAFHEILQEKDEFRTPALIEILRFFVRPSRKPGSVLGKNIEGTLGDVDWFLANKEFARARYTMEEAIDVHQMMTLESKTWGSLWDKSIRTATERVRTETHEISLDDLQMWNYLDARRRQEMKAAMQKRIFKMFLPR